MTITPREIADLLALSKRDIRASEAMLDTDLDWAFAIAYNGVLQMSIAYMNHLGYRPRGEGKHYNTFQFMEEALPDEAPMIRRLQKLRRKRNTTIYEQSGLVSEKEAQDVIEFASRYYTSIEAKLPREITGQAPKED
ncbi:MAG: hypothetical protein Q8K99_12210 [Actinomycetota bacterium]|nr:hypothetical protein [Actinomycetota bacterium]